MSPLGIWRKLDLETITLEAFASLDSQGLPTYGTAQTFDGHVRFVDEFLTKPDGSQTRINLKIWVPGSETVVPGEQDRVTIASLPYIVELAKPVRPLKSSRTSLDHTKLMCRE